MPRFMKYLLYSIGGLVLLVLGGAVAVFATTQRALAKTMPLPAHGFTAPTDPASIERGEHLVRALVKCVDCHGQDLGGQLMLDDPAIGTLYAPNLTRGRGGLPTIQDDAAFERAIRHGLGRDGRRLVVMPSEEYQHVSDEDLGAIIAYVKSVPPVDREHPLPRLGPLARVLYLAGEFPLFGYEKITHAEDVVPAVPVDSTAAYGKYLGDIGCAGCHGAGYGGGKIPGGPPDWPPTANLTPTGIGHYTYEGFANLLRTGKRPDGSQVADFMPIVTTKLMTDVEIKAMWNYLRTLPPKEFGTR
jgi:mono/diheme cytochrome c family protein